jgi:hypothetical protein
VTLDEFSATPGSPNVAAGTITFEATNEGEEPHELVVVRVEDAESLPVAEGQVQEDALPAGAFIGEIEAFPAGEECEGTFELAAGDYVLFCNVVEKKMAARSKVTSRWGCIRSSPSPDSCKPRHRGFIARAGGRHRIPICSPRPAPAEHRQKEGDSQPHTV